MVVGETHPRVLERDGEAYRNGLVARAERLGVADMVTFTPGYLDVASLGSLAAAADVVILPYDSREQVTSGVLIEAVTARRPVIATAFPTPSSCSARAPASSSTTTTPMPWPTRSARCCASRRRPPSWPSGAAALAPDLLWSAVARPLPAASPTTSSAPTPRPSHERAGPVVRSRPAAHRRRRHLRARRRLRTAATPRLLPRRRRPSARRRRSPARAVTARRRPDAALPRLRHQCASGRRALPQPARAGSPWEDEPGIEDCWGRALWGSGDRRRTAPPTPAVRRRAADGFARSARWRCRLPHGRWRSPRWARRRS